MKQFIVGLLFSLLIGLLNFVYTQRINIESIKRDNTQLEFQKTTFETLVVIQQAIVRLLKSK